jgi:gliding motility-associated protein GldM
MSGGGKETPRQAMIGMMYLFYTALLALNVSAEILTAFTLVDGSLRKTNTITEGVIEGTQTEFAKAMINNPAGTKKYNDLAVEVAAAADKAYKEIQHYKLALVGTLEGVYGDNDYTAPYSEASDAKDQEIEKALRDKWVADKPEAADPNLVDIDDLVSKKDDNNVGGEIFITKGQGKVIAAGREGYKNTLIDIVNKGTDNSEASQKAKQSLIASLNELLSTARMKSESDDIDSVDWDVSNFEHLPAAGVLTLMTKMQADVRNTESSVLSYLISQIGKTDMKFNAIRAVVSPTTSSYVLVNEPYKADVFIAAYDSAQNPDILVGGSPLKVEKGVGKYTGNTSSVGVKTFSGVIKLKNNSTGEIKEYPFKSEYEVGQSSLSVSPTKMNVLYIGVPNPLEVTASGYNSEKLHVTISQGSVSKGTAAGAYSALVKTPGTAKVTVTATVDGQTKNLGTREFRVKRVPDPRASVTTKEAWGKGGTVSKAMLAASAGVKAELENFDFDMKFQITGFKVSATIKGFVQDATSTGPAFTAQQKTIINQAPAGSKLYIEEIKAKGPDGSLRDLGAIVLKLK